MTPTMADSVLLLIYGAVVLGVFVLGVRPGVLFAGAAVAFSHQISSVAGHFLVTLR